MARVRQVLCYQRVEILRFALLREDVARGASGCVGARAGGVVVVAMADAFCSLARYVCDLTASECGVPGTVSGGPRERSTVALRFHKRHGLGGFNSGPQWGSADGRPPTGSLTVYPSPSPARARRTAPRPGPGPWRALGPLAAARARTAPEPPRAYACDVQSRRSVRTQVLTPVGAMHRARGAQRHCCNPAPGPPPHFVAHNASARRGAWSAVHRPPAALAQGARRRRPNTVPVGHPGARAHPHHAVTTFTC